MAAVTVRIAAVLGDLVTVDLTYDDVTLAFDRVDVTNNRAGDVTFTVTDTATAASWTWTVRGGRTASRKVSGNFGFVRVVDPDTGEESLGLGTLTVSGTSGG